MASDSALVRWIMCVSDGTGRPSLARPTALEWRNRTASIYAYKAHTCYFEFTAERKEYYLKIVLPTVSNYWARYMRIAQIENKVTPIIESFHCTCTILNIMLVYFNITLHEAMIKCFVCLYTWSSKTHFKTIVCLRKCIIIIVIIIIRSYFILRSNFHY